MEGAARQSHFSIGTFGTRSWSGFVFNCVRTFANVPYAIGSRARAANFPTRRSQGEATAESNTARDDERVVSRPNDSGVRTPMLRPLRRKRAHCRHDEPICRAIDSIVRLQCGGARFSLKRGCDATARAFGTKSGSRRLAYAVIRGGRFKGKYGDTLGQMQG